MFHEDRPNQKSTCCFDSSVHAGRRHFALDDGRRASHQVVNYEPAVKISTGTRKRDAVDPETTQMKRRRNETDSKTRHGKIVITGGYHSRLEAFASSISSLVVSFNGIMVVWAAQCTTNIDAMISSFGMRSSAISFPSDCVCVTRQWLALVSYRRSMDNGPFRFGHQKRKPDGFNCPGAV